MSELVILSDIEEYNSDDESLLDNSFNSSISIDYLVMLGLSHEDTFLSQQTTLNVNRSESSLSSSFFQLDLSDSITSE
jgi:hypothetical protein